MPAKDSHESTSGPPLEPDGGAAGDGEQPDEDIDYLEREVNLLRPSTPFMRDHLKVIWTGFVAWAIIVFGPVTATRIAPGVMTSQMPLLGFPLHYFLVAIGAPGGALLLAFWYARKRDQLDEKYGIEHPTTDNIGSSDPEEIAATDGGQK